MVDRISLPAGQELFAEGSRGDSAYVIELGELEILKASGNRPILLAVRKTGDVIGEIALLEDVPRTATVRARSDSVLYAIQQEQFEHLLNASPTASRGDFGYGAGALAQYLGGPPPEREDGAARHLDRRCGPWQLNNPAAAVKRGVEQLTEAVTSLLHAQAQVRRARLGHGPTGSLACGGR